jgi:hypothetical protein
MPLLVVACLWVLSHLVQALDGLLYVCAHFINKNQFAGGFAGRWVVFFSVD